MITMLGMSDSPSPRDPREDDLAADPSTAPADHAAPAEAESANAFAPSPGAAGGPPPIRPPEAGQSAPPVDDEPGVAERLAPHLQPRVEQAKINLRVWVPFLMSAQERMRMLKYNHREARDGSEWKVILPPRCWKTGATEGLRTRRYEVEIRSFDSGPGILFGTLGICGGFMLIGMLLGFWPLFIVGLLGVPVGLTIMLVKSWPESVMIEMSSLPEHADDMKRPDLVVYENELYVFVPSEELANAAREEQTARRRAGPRHIATARGIDGGMRPTAPSGGASAPAASTKVKYERAELPPINLDDDTGGSATGGDAGSIETRHGGYRRSDLPSIKLDDDEPT